MKTVNPSSIDLSSKKRLAGFEGGAVYTAESGGLFYLIQDETSFASILDAEDLDGLVLLKCFEFETSAERAQYVSQRGWDRRPDNGLEAEL